MAIDFDTNRHGRIPKDPRVFFKRGQDPDGPVIGRDVPGSEDGLQLIEIGYIDFGSEFPPERRYKHTARCPNCKRWLYYSNPLNITNLMEFLQTCTDARLREIALTDMNECRTLYGHCEDHRSWEQGPAAPQTKYGGSAMRA